MEKDIYDAAQKYTKTHINVTTGGIYEKVTAKKNTKG